MPRNTVQWLAALCVPIGLLAGASEAAFGAGEFPAGVGAGLWLAAAYLWVTGEAC